MCSCKSHTSQRKDAANDAAAVEPNPRLLLAVVAVAVIAGALLSPSKPGRTQLAAQTPVAASAAENAR